MELFTDWIWKVKDREVQEMLCCLSCHLEHKLGKKSRGLNFVFIFVSLQACVPSLPSRV